MRIISFFMLTGYFVLSLTVLSVIAADAEQKLYINSALQGREAEFEKRMQTRLHVYNGTPETDASAGFILNNSLGNKVDAEYKLQYPSSSLASAETDAEKILIYMLEEMVDMGINPQQENITVVLRLVAPDSNTEQGKTIDYGCMKYYPNSNMVRWEATKK